MLVGRKGPYTCWPRWLLICRIALHSSYMSWCHHCSNWQTSSIFLIRQQIFREICHSHRHVHPHCELRNMPLWPCACSMLLALPGGCIRNGSDGVRNSLLCWNVLPSMRWSLTIYSHLLLFQQ